MQPFNRVSPQDWIHRVSHTRPRARPGTSRTAVSLLSLQIGDEDKLLRSWKRAVTKKGYICLLNKAISVNAVHRTQKWVLSEQGC